MAIALWTLLLAALMPIVCAGIAKVGPGRYDNRNPRDWQAKQQGYRARAYEALAVYVAALVAAFIGNVPLETLGLIAGIFAASRVAYLVCYLADLATLRSLVWLVGFGSCICLIVMGAQSI
jgi:uncharacterized MAPEG superfamily protein